MFDIIKEKKYIKLFCANFSLFGGSRGYAGIIALLTVCSVVLILTFSLGATIVAKKQISKNLSNSIRSYYLAESGMEDAIYRKIKGLSLPFGTSDFGDSDINIDQTFITTGNEVTIDSVSNYDGNYRKVRTLLTKTTTGAAFHYGVQVGEGGLSMLNGSIINGNLYSDGSVIGQTDSAAITGDVIVATGMILDSSKGEWETYSSDTIFGKTPSTDIAISYTPSLSGKLSQVAFYLKRTNNTPSDGIIKIVTNNAGSPSTTLVAASATADFIAAKVGESYGWVNFSFTNPPTLVAGTTYWIVIDLGSSNSKYFFIGTSAGNANSVSKYSTDFSAGSWTLEAGGDYEFRAWIGGLATFVENITIGGSAFAHEIKTSNICGDAHYQAIDAGSLAFLGSPTTAKCDPLFLPPLYPTPPPVTPGTATSGAADPAVVAMPLSQGNITDWETAASAGVLLDSFCDSDSASITLNAGVMNCDFRPTHSKPVITLNGVVWVKGDIVLPNDSIMQLSSGYGAISGVIIADHPTTPSLKGKINTGIGTLVCGSQGYNPGASPTCKGSNGSYLMLLSTFNNLASSAIEISNNASGAIYYASRGIANVNNNASNVKEVTAYRLILANGASISYESGLESAAFSSGPGGGWEINSWNETK